MVRIHAGEPHCGFNNLQDYCPVLVRILYRSCRIVGFNPLMGFAERVEHGFVLRVNADTDVLGTGTRRMDPPATLRSSSYALGELNARSAA